MQGLQALTKLTLPAMQAAVGDHTLLWMVSLLQLCCQGAEGCGMRAVLSHHPPCSGHKQQNAHTLEARFRTIM